MDLDQITTPADLLAAAEAGDADLLAAVREVETEQAWDAADELAAYRPAQSEGA